MKYTNKYNLPESIFTALCGNDYNNQGTDYSVTTLLKAPRIVQLERRYWDECEQDVTDRLSSFAGSGIHGRLEYFLRKDKTFIVEHRVFTEVMGRKVSGQADVFKKGKLSDFKTTSVWSVINHDSKMQDWEAQLNIYRYLFSLDSIVVNELEIIAWCMDWERSKAMRERNYPPQRVVTLPVTCWDLKYTAQFVQDRVALHIAAESCDDSSLPLCSAKDTWESSTRYAVMQPGKDRATRVLDTEQDAVQYIDERRLKDATVVCRPGRRVRCEDYCMVNRWCSQFKEYCETT